MNTSAPACAVALDVARHGDFGDCLQLTATVDGQAPPSYGGELLLIRYRGRTVAWVTMPTEAPRKTVIAAVLKRADWFLGSRCPDMGSYPLEFR
jgi:hypothetical protein